MWSLFAMTDLTKLHHHLVIEFHVLEAKFLNFTELGQFFWTEVFIDADILGVPHFELFEDFSIVNLEEVWSGQVTKLANIQVENKQKIRNKKIKIKIMFAVCNQNKYKKNF